MNSIHSYPKHTRQPTMKMRVKDRDPSNPIFRMLSLKSIFFLGISILLNIFKQPVSILLKHYLNLIHERTMTNLTVHQITLPSVKKHLRNPLYNAH